ncbi:unnamed protein product [Polarella glacialis]|uniref:Pseudouridine synthase RsuA/RluA-like domain-containing protein n=1 Tax=Polarella glacialis TaxID=89957 RepID=A0A813EEK9_POLGL|nr:unnamed protein product [Polarella glacialis]CAE8641206.1 unnamed protein product [Polarella glacialis]
MVHRLDVGTSGPLLVARTVEAWNWAKDRIYKRDQLRDYVALVHGSFKSRNAEGGEGLEERGVVLANIDDAGYTKYSRVEISEAAGESATTFYEALAEYQSESGRDRYTLVHLRLETGRTHQIRVHMEHLQRPLVGDRTYGSKARNTWLQCERPFLHKVRFVFATFPSADPVVVWSPLTMAPDLCDVLRKLRLVNGIDIMNCGAAEELCLRSSHGSHY